LYQLVGLIKIHKMKVSFDFDDTLEFEDVQKFAKELIDKDVEVHIVTSRFEDLKRYHPDMNATHDDLFLVADKLGIPRDRIHFTNFNDKWKFLEGQDFVWHLDDNENEIKSITIFTECKGLDVLSPNYTYRGLKLLNLL
jgi:hypothetical protein